MSWDLALHTVVSFLTNTDQQHYSGQAQRVDDYPGKRVDFGGALRPVHERAALLHVRVSLVSQKLEVSGDQREKKHWDVRTRVGVRVHQPLCIPLPASWRKHSQMADKLEASADARHSAAPNDCSHDLWSKGEATQQKGLFSSVDRKTTRHRTRN